MGCGVDVALDDVAVEPIAEPHAAFEVHAGARLPGAQGGQSEGFCDGRHGPCSGFEGNGGEADAVVGNALVYADLVREAPFHREMHICALLTHSAHRAYSFDDSRKHAIPCGPEAHR